MPDTSDIVKPDAIRVELEQLIASFDMSVPPSLAEAMQSLQTALTFQDSTLVRSSVESAFHAVTEVVSAEVERRLQWSNRAITGIQSFLNSIEDEPIEPDEEWDGLGKQANSMHDRIQPVLVDLQTRLGAVLREFKPDLAAKLEGEISQWKTMKENVLDRWPWTNRDFLPVDREMLAESRKLIERREGESIEELTRRWDEMAKIR